MFLGNKFTLFDGSGTIEKSQIFTVLNPEYGDIPPIVLT